MSKPSQTLTALGLTADEAQIYSLLLEHGKLQASAIARHVTFSRGLVYKILDDLITKGLARKIDERGAVAHFIPSHPVALRTLVDEKERVARHAAHTFEELIASLTHTYTVATKSPGFVFEAGIAGFRKLHEDILRTKKPLLLIRSHKDKHDAMLSEVLRTYLAKQVAAGITTRAITPIDFSKPVPILHADKKYRVTRRMIDHTLFQLDAQIMIYGETVAIVAYEKDEILVTRITSIAIRQTMTALFEYMWLISTPEHERQAIRFM